MLESFYSLFFDGSVSREGLHSMPDAVLVGLLEQLSQFVLPGEVMVVLQALRAAGRRLPFLQHPVQQPPAIFKHRSFITMWFYGSTYFHEPKGAPRSCRSAVHNRKE